MNMFKYGYAQNNKLMGNTQSRRKKSPPSVGGPYLKLM